ncbi:MAG TPA: homocysteine S-methyltransferase family protein, partial [Polyangiaceae bacterium]|nr:homocysteine S-methyltransferase family protein [Polyangiaceae bacterium]
MSSGGNPEKKLLEALRHGTLVVDGAMGSQLYERGVLYSVCFEELNTSRPELVRKIHEDYIRAGAQLIETNTFGANAMRLEKHGLQSRVKELNLAAVRVAREAAGAKAYVGGAIGPSGYFLGEALDVDLRRVGDALLEQAEALVEAGVDVLMIETMRQSVELRVAIEAARKASGGRVPIVAEVSVDEAGRLADGKTSGDIGKMMIDWGADVIGINCSEGPMGVLSAVEPMLALGVPV